MRQLRDYSLPPGSYLEEVLEQRGIRKTDFAVRCGRPAKTISEIIAGKASITPDTALQFERVLDDIPADHWLAWEANHQLFEARSRERQGFTRAVGWVRNFPINDMQKKGFLPQASDPVDLVDKVLSFFGVSSVEAWEEYWEQRVTSARFKKSAGVSRNQFAVAAWLRFGDARAAAVECEPYNEMKFKATLDKSRPMTRQSWPSIQDELVAAFAAAGVAVALIPDLHGLGLRGAAYWASKDKAVIVMSDRLKEESRFWFALFHEAMHILLHSKKALFIDYLNHNDREAEEEREANQHAADTLIPKGALEQFFKCYGRAKNSYTANVISTFAREIDIDPGLVLVRLQFDDLVSWNSMLIKKFRKPMEFNNTH